MPSQERLFRWSFRGMPSLQIQRLDLAWNAFWNADRYLSTSDSRDISQSLLETAGALLGGFARESQKIAEPLSGPEIDVAATEVRNNVDSYLLNIRELIKQLEAKIGDQNLMHAHDVMKHTLHGEIERIRIDARAQF